MFEPPNSSSLVTYSHIEILMFIQPSLSVFSARLLKDLSLARFTRLLESRALLRSTNAHRLTIANHDRTFILIILHGNITAPLKT